MPSITESSRIAFNEVTFGFTPHAGATYYASRLPGELGTYMLLTGSAITGKDAVALGLADKMIDIPEAYEREVCDAVRDMDAHHMPTSRQVNGLLNPRMARDHIDSADKAVLDRLNNKTRHD